MRDRVVDEDGFDADDDLSNTHVTCLCCMIFVCVFIACICVYLASVLSVHGPYDTTLMVYNALVDFLFDDVTVMFLLMVIACVVAFMLVFLVTSQCSKSNDSGGAPNTNSTTTVTTNDSTTMSATTHVEEHSEITSIELPPEENPEPSPFAMADPTADKAHELPPCNEEVTYAPMVVESTTPSPPSSECDV